MALLVILPTADEKIRQSFSTAGTPSMQAFTGKNGKERPFFRAFAGR
jgi:hypothetical protein